MFDIFSLGVFSFGVFCFGLFYAYQYVFIAINSCRADVNTDIEHITLRVTIFNEEASTRMELRFIWLLHIINRFVYIKEHACIYTIRRERERKKEKRMMEVAGRLVMRRNI